MVGRHRRIRLRAEFRTWRCLASRSRAAASSLRRVRARRGRCWRRRRCVLAAFTRVVRDARWVDSADRRADRCARRSTWRRAVPRAFATWRLASRATRPRRRRTRRARRRRVGARRVSRARRDATGGVDHTSPRVSRVDESPRRFGSRARVDSYLRRRRRTKTTRGGGARRKPRGPRRRRVSSDETPRRGWRRRSRFERRGFSPRMAPTLAFRATRLLAVGARGGNPGRDGRRKNNDKNSRARNATSPGGRSRGRRASATVRLALPGDSSDSESENDAGRPCREIRDGGAGKRRARLWTWTRAEGATATESFRSRTRCSARRRPRRWRGRTESRGPRALGGLRGDGPGRRVRTTTIGCSNGRRVDKWEICARKNSFARRAHTRK